MSSGYWVLYDTEYDGEQRRHVDGQNPDYVSAWSWRSGISDSGDAAVTLVGVGGFTSTKGRLRPWFRWVRRTIQQGSGYYTQSVPDPADNPPASLFFVATGGATVNSISDFVNGGPWPALNRMASTEYVTISMLGQSVGGHDENHATRAELQIEEVYPVATGGALQTSPEGYEIVPGPWLSLDVKTGVQGNRYTGSGPGSGALTGRAGRGVSLNNEPQNYWATSPNPHGLALAPCPDPTPQAALNQYVMIGGGGTFTIPTVVGYTGSSSQFYYRLVHGLDWTIGRAPSTMLPRVPNGSTTHSGNNTSFFPQHLPSGSSSAVPGLAFDNILPAGNGPFGVNSIAHSFEGATFATSNFALFYQGGTYTHPIGASEWCQRTVIGTPGHLRPDYLISGYSPIPNWFHYYSQAYPSPEPIAYLPSSSASTQASNYDPIQGHIHISDDAYGANSNRIWETRPASGPFVVMVGHQQTYGIDTFASVIAHEVAHKRVHESIRDGELDDTDGDGLPDAYEIVNHLDPNVKDTTNFGKTFPNYANFADQDVYCQIQQLDVTGPRELDWANNGLNWGRVPGSCPADRNPKTYYATPAVPPR